MSLNKLAKFSALHEMPNVFQNEDYKNPHIKNLNQTIEVKGHWKNDIFQNQNPLVLELACGKGEYSVSLAQAYPNKNFLGVDIKGNRIYSGAKKALENNLNNAKFLRTRIEQMDNFFLPDEIDEVWITFPDPFPKLADRSNRLISPKYLNFYKKHFSTKPIQYHLKTDNLPLFRYAIGVLDGRGEQILQCMEDIYDKDKKVDDILKIETYYEQLHRGQGSQIHYVNWMM